MGRALPVSAGLSNLEEAARRRFAERLVEVDRLCKLLADEVIVLREFGVAGKCSLDEIGLAAA